MSRKMRLYISGSSDEVERAMTWTGRAKQAGIECVHTWIGNVIKVGTGNPRDASRQDRSTWAQADLVEVLTADTIWMLAPEKSPGRGAYGEWCFSYAHNKILVSSGDTLQSIFTALGLEFETDEQAFQHIKWIADTVKF